MTNDNIWHYSTGYYKAFTDSYEVKQRIVKDLGLEVCNLYEKPKGWDFIVPKDQLSKVKRLLKTKDQIIEKQGEIVE